MRYIRKHKLTGFIIVLFIVAIFGLGQLNRVFQSNVGNPVYGNRLDNISGIDIDTPLKEYEKKIKAIAEIDSINIDKTGKIINIKFVFKANVSKDNAKKISNQVFENFNDDVLKNFSFQVFCDKYSNDASFPFIGYYQANTNRSFVWTKG